MKIFMALICLVGLSIADARSISSKKTKNEFDVKKTPKSLFLIKKKIDEKDFGEPALKIFDQQMKVISEDIRLGQPFATKIE